MSIALLVAATALLSAAFTAVALVVVFRRVLLPELEQRMAARMDVAREEFAVSVERAVRKGVLDGVASIPSREVLQDTTRTIARTGMELMGDSLSSLLGRRGARRDDRKDDAEGSDDPVT